MTDEPTPNRRSWFERLSLVLLGEPKDREELISLLREAEQRDLLDHEALSMIEGAIHVSEMQVSEIMIPKKKMVVISKESSFSDILAKVTQFEHSRYPVIGDNKDEILGVMLAKDLLIYQADPSTLDKFNIREILRPTLIVPENKRLNILLNEFRKSHTHLAMVVDEYGSVTGLVTIEDVLEQIVGDIEDEHDIDEAKLIRRHTQNSFTVEALIPIGKFNQFFKTEFESETFDTMAGVVMQAFGHLPQRGESIEIDDITFTIKKANSRRIQVLAVTLPNRLEKK